MSVSGVEQPHNMGPGDASSEQHAMRTQANMQFYFNTGATNHISLNQGDFSGFEPIELRNIHGVNGSPVPAMGIGKIKL